MFYAFIYSVFSLFFVCPFACATLCTCELVRITAEIAQLAFIADVDVLALTSCPQWQLRPTLGNFYTSGGLKN